MGHSTMGDLLVYYGEFAHASGWSGNPGTVDFAEGSAFSDLAGDTITGSVNGNPVTVTMVVYPGTP
jgi:hypothetical protein